MGPQDGPGAGRSVNDQPAAGLEADDGSLPTRCPSRRGPTRARVGTLAAPHGAPRASGPDSPALAAAVPQLVGVGRRPETKRASHGRSHGWNSPSRCPLGRSACADHRSRSTAAGGPGLSPRRPVVESRRMSPPAPVSARQLRWPRSAVGIAPTLREGLGETTSPCNTVVSKYRGPGSQRDRAVSKQVHRR